jgi:hypothetical protein
MQAQVQSKRFHAVRFLIITTNPFRIISNFPTKGKQASRQRPGMRCQKAAIHVQNRKINTIMVWRTRLEHNHKDQKIVSTRQTVRHKQKTQNVASQHAAPTSYLVYLFCLVFRYVAHDHGCVNLKPCRRDADCRS